MKKQPYHSALLKPVTNLPIVRSIEKDGSHAFAADIFNGLDSRFSLCDVLYVEPPWQKGFQTFEQRAGVSSDERTYPNLIAHVAKIIKESQIPVVLVTGKHALSHFPPPLSTFASFIPEHSSNVVVNTYGHYIPLAYQKTTDDTLNYLSDTFNCVGDFMCGYGKTARAFYEKGKRFVASDYNMHCISYFPEWWK